MRCLDPVTGNFEVVFSSEEAEFSAMDVTADANVAIMGDNDGYLHVFDIRENKAEQRGKDAELHNKRVNTLHVSLFTFLYFLCSFLNAKVMQDRIVLDSFCREILGEFEGRGSMRQVSRVGLRVP